MAVLALGYVLLLAYLHYQGDTEIQRIYGGSTGLATLKYADRIEAYRIDKRADPNNWENVAVADFPILKGPIAVGQANAEVLQHTLLDRNSYIWMPKGCNPVPGVRIDFIRGDKHLTVFVCFECDMTTNVLNGKIVGGGNIDKARPTLVRIARALFPDDATIQSLPEQPSTLLLSK
jgi:hypothetical protein